MKNSPVVPSALSPIDIAMSLKEYWSPIVISELEDCYIKVAKLEGSLTWHKHENEDELFLVLKGSLTIELEGSKVELKEGELYVVPKGVNHNPVAKHECYVMLIERKETAHTGDVIMELTRSRQEQLGEF